MSNIINIYTLCNDECEHGHHNELYEICDRCGSHIHSKVYEIQHDTEGNIKVGSECFKDAMRFKYNTYHEKAEKLKNNIVEEVKKLKEKHSINKELKLKIRNFISEIIIEYPTGLNTIKGKLNKSIITAGLDLGLWETINYKSIIVKI